VEGEHRAEKPSSYDPCCKLAPRTNSNQTLEFARLTSLPRKARQVPLRTAPIFSAQNIQRRMTELDQPPI
jgi:hypothetical protein